MGVEVCKRFLEEGRVHTALYADASTVLSELSYHDKGDNPIVKYSRPDILLLDDVGALSTEMTAVRKTGLGAIINQRWLDGKYTIMSTNLSVATQEGSNAFTLHEYLGETSWDRVLSSHLLLSFTGDSMRRKNIPRAAQPQESHTTKRRRRR